MKIKYRITTSTLWNEDIGFYKTFGASLDGTPYHIKDISPNKATTQKVIKILNLLQVKGEEMTTVIETILALF